MALSTYVLGEPAPRDGWLISEWDQGFSPTEWQADNVYEEVAATVFELDTTGHSDPYAGAEVQSSVTATTGTWAWHAKAPDMVPGTVFGLFLFQADWRHPRLEFDFEIVGDDPTTIELVTHMAMADGRKQTAVRKVKLDFDPSAGFNLYEIFLDGSSATFRINGSVAATFDRQDFGGYWRTGEVRSYINLWVADAPGWAGLLDPNTLPIRAEILSAGWQPNQISWTGTAGADHFRSGPLADILDGLSGADQRYGEAAVRKNRMGRPSASATACSLVFRPPFARPMRRPRPLFWPAGLRPCGAP